MSDAEEDDIPNDKDSLRSERSTLFALSLGERA
jgi:hypothetical protein